MRIRRKFTNQEIGGSYQHWKDQILSKHLEDNYEILTHPDIVDVFETDTSNGKKIYIETTDKYIAIQKYIQQSDIYSIKNTTAKFDEFYRMIIKPKEAPVFDIPELLYNLTKDPKYQKPQVELKAVPDMKKFSKIFISHSSKDKKYIIEIIELLETIGIKSEDIFCSSLEGYGISLGENFLETLKKELNDNVLVIFVLSNNFYKSPICLCEMGATWIKTNTHIPILIPPFDFSKIKGVIQNTQGLKLNEPQQLNLLKDKLERAFNLPPLNSTLWENKRNRVLDHIEKLIESEKPKSQTISMKEKSKNNNAIQMITAYASEHMLSSISFEKIIENINPKFNEDYLMNLIEENPFHIRRVKLKNGQFGIKLLQK